MIGPTQAGSTRRPHDCVERDDTIVFEEVYITSTEARLLANIVGTADVCRQVLNGERVIKTALLNPTCGAVLGGLLEEVGNLIEAPAVESFFARGKFVVGGGELDIASISGDVEDLWSIVEIGLHAGVLKRRQLLKRAVDVRILTILDQASIWAAHLYWLLLQTETRLDDFHCFVDAETLLSIHVWYDNGRHLEVLRVPYPRELECGDIVIAP
jgi:hypothetical protein